jgi:acyl-CoA thioesterase
MTGRTPQAMAEACAAAMWAEDRASQDLGMELLRVGPGTAELAMLVRPDMVNGHGLCHGGFIFALADSAFAFACNSHGPRTVAAHGAITFMAPARLGDRLVASAVERRRFGRNGIYDIAVTRAGDGVLIAELRGHSRTVGGSLLPAGQGEDGPAA